MIYRVTIVAVLFLVSAANSFGQYDFKGVLSDLDGQDLMEQLAIDYKPSSVLSYDVARDTMFRRVYGVNDSLSCVYTGHRLFMPPGEDPTQAVYLSGIAGGINTEHSWPQSYGAQIGNARSDMHHLFPTRVDVNGDRDKLPFLEIPDAQTQQWYFMDSNQSGIPNLNIDLYSERSGNAFEPREDHKGNVARAMMYFQAIYPTEALQAPNDFFDSMRQTLCEWHYLDPVDSIEWHRSYKIAEYQSGKVNPFILDCTLATRLYCPQTQVACDPSVSPVRNIEWLTFSLYPNPGSGSFTLVLPSVLQKQSTILIYNALGIQVFEKNIFPEESSLSFDLKDQLSPGLYWIKLYNEEGAGVESLIIE